MCGVVAKDRFTGVRFPSEEGTFTSLKGQSEEDHRPTSAPKFQIAEKFPNK